MSSYAQRFYRTLTRRSSQMLLHPNRRSEVFIDRRQLFQRQKSPVETGRERLFRRLPTADNAVDHNGPIFAAVKRKQLKSITFSERPTDNGLQFPTHPTKTIDTHNVLNLLQVMNSTPVNLNVGSGIKLIEEVDKRSVEYSGNDLVHQWIPGCKLTCVGEHLQGPCVKTEKRDSEIDCERLGAETIGREFDVLGKKPTNIQRHQLVAIYEYLQIICKFQSTAPTVVGCEYKAGCNVTKSLLVSGSVSTFSKINTVKPRMMPFRSNNGPATGRNYSSKSGGSTDEPPIDPLSSQKDTTNNKQTFIEEMDVLKKKLDHTELEIANILDKTLYFEFQFMYMVNPLFKAMNNSNQNKHFIYFFDKKTKTNLLKMVSDHESIKKKMKKLVALSVPVSRGTDIHQNITRPPWKK